MIDMTVRSADFGTQLARIPDPDRIPIKAVREAAGKLAERLTQLREASARLRIADNAQHRARELVNAQAADAADGGGEVPTKELVKALREAEDELEEARIEVRAREHAATKARTKLIEAIEKHTPAWREAAMRAADKGILKLTTARRQVETAAAELAEPLAVLAMLERIPVDRLPVMADPGKSGMYASQALGNLTSAIGEAMETYDGFRGAAADIPDVEVPAPDEEGETDGEG